MLQSERGKRLEVRGQRLKIRISNVKVQMTNDGVRNTSTSTNHTDTRHEHEHERCGHETRESMAKLTVGNPWKPGKTKSGRREMWATDQKPLKRRDNVFSREKVDNQVGK